MSHAGDLLAELLAGYGVTHVFGQPGGQTVALYDGLNRRKDRIAHLLVRDERSAGYAADAFARLTGRPGVCDVTVGPGTTKLADGLVESLNASVPVIALIGELPSVAALPQMVRSAFRLATSGRPGPVALVLPHDVLDADWEPETAATEVDDRYREYPAYRPVASPDTVAAAAELLDASRRPVVVAGGGVHASQATAELASLLEMLGAMAVTSFSGKGAVAETARNAAGVLNPLGPTESLEIVRHADLVFWFGCKAGQNTTHNWTLPLPQQATIHLDIDPAELGRTFRPTVALCGDVRATLAALIALVKKQPRADWLRETTRIKADAAELRAEAQASDAVPIQPPRVMCEL